MSAVTVVLTACFVAQPTSGDSEQSRIDFFEKHIRPVLVERCYGCHSREAKTLRGNLYLDTRAGWERGGDSGPAIVPGDPDGSLLVRAVRYTDDTLKMPPTGKLPPAEIAAIELWVARGAADPRDGVAHPPDADDDDGIDIEAGREFWAFRPPARSPPPPVAGAAWPRDPLDSFILARLEAAGLEPAPDADAATLVRRLSFVLGGLPPEVEDLDAFDGDRSPDALSRLVDRLLASPRFGEHWGRHWLDVARYADSNGSDFNATFFNAWRYRDWVIDAFNRDAPFDGFVREQIAGDLIPAKTDDEREGGLIATGFLMVVPKMLSERDKEKLTLDVADEQIDSVGRVFLGLTLGCARCHDHKFDPVGMEDYYALAGIFTSTVVLEGERQEYVSDWLERELPIPREHADALRAHADTIAKLKGEIEEAKKAVEAAKKELAKHPRRLAGIVVDDAQAKVVGEWKASTYHPTYVGEGYIHDDKEEKGKRSVTFTPELPRAGEYEVRIAYAGGSGRDRAVPVTVRHAGGTAELRVDQVPRPPIDGLFLSLGRFRFDAGVSGEVTISNAGTEGYVIADAAQFIPVEEIESDGERLAVAPADDDPADGARAAVSAATQRLTRLEGELKRVEEVAPPPAPRAMAVRDRDEPADERIRVRGEHENYGDAVPRGFIRVASRGDCRVGDRRASGRLELAEWIASRDNPLTARVIANRVWQHALGEGIVRSVDNFGALGERPTHPELLDRIAVDLADGGWSVKRLLRRLVLSRTASMSGRHGERAAAADPENRLLWRAHRRRLSAEEIRDAALAASGRLDLAMGGSPVAGFGKNAIDNDNQNSGSVDYDGLRCRSIYMPLVRNDLPPALAVFDLADPDMVVGRRPTTNVPAQALFLLNSPFARGRAAETAARLLAGKAEDGERVERAYRLLLARRPSAPERERALAFLELERSGEVEAAAEGATDDDPGGTRRAWTLLVQALMASTEFRMLE